MANRFLAISFSKVIVFMLDTGIDPVAPVIPDDSTSRFSSAYSVESLPLAAILLRRLMFRTMAHTEMQLAQSV